MNYTTVSDQVQIQTKDFLTFVNRPIARIDYLP